MRMQGFEATRRWLIAVSIAALGACGDDDGGKKTDTATTPTDTAVATETTTTTDTAVATETTTATDTAGETAVDNVTWDEVAEIFRDNCTPCHSTGSSGGHNIAATDVATSYAQSQKAVSAGAPSKCAGKKVGECAALRIDDGSMPLGGGCADDRNKAGCPTAAELQLIQDWIEDGMLGPAN